MREMYAWFFGGDSYKTGVTAHKSMGNDYAEVTWCGVRHKVGEV